MRLTITRDAEEFTARTRALFETRIECNLIATVSAGVLAGHYPRSVPLFAYVTERDEVRFAALRTPPWEMLATALPHPLPVQSALMRSWLRDDPAVPGVEAPLDAARAIATAWAEETGGTSRRKLRERSYVLERVSDPPRPAPGKLRLARERELPLMLEWVKAFVRELAALPEERAQVIVDARAAERGLWVWDHDGPVSMLGTAPLVAGAVRLGPVYTPPEHRRRGYAGSAVAAASREALSRGAQRCVLYTDATNPTSNKVYAEVGYRRSGEHEKWVFERRA